MTTRRQAVRSALRTVRRRRGLLAAALVAGAVATALPQLSPGVPATETVLVAARDLAAGVPLTAGDVARVALPAGARPDGALPVGPVDGLHLAGAVRRGEPLTDVRLLGAALLDTPAASAGLVAVPVRLADAAGAALVRPGDRVDVLAAAADGSSATASVPAEDVAVLAVPSHDPAEEGGLLVLATTPGQAGRLAAAAVRARLSVLVRSR